MRKLLIALSILLLVGMTCAATVTLLGKGVGLSGTYVNWTVSPLTVNKAKVADGGTTVALDIALNGTNASDVVVQINKGGTARSNTEDYGTGKNYTLSAVQVTIPAGSTTPAAQPTCTIVNNPIYDLDQQAIFTLSIVSPVGVSATADARIVNIADDGVNRVYKDAVVDGSLVGDGSTDNSTALSNLITTVRGLQSADGNTNKYGGVIEFPAGTYIIDANVRIYPGITYVSKSGAIIKRINSWTPTGLNEGGIWYTGTWVGPSGTDSNPLVIKGLTFDGNAPAAADVSEHHNNLDLEGGRLDSTDGYVKLYVDGVTSHDSYAEGIQIDQSIKAEVYDVYTYNNHQYGLTPTYPGKNSVINIRKHKARLTTEYSWGEGLYTEGFSYRCTINIDDCDYMNGYVPYRLRFVPCNMSNSTIGTNDPAGTVDITVNDVQMQGVLQSDNEGGQGRLTINDSTFENMYSGASLTINRPAGFQFNNCTFKAMYLAGYTGYPYRCVPLLGWYPVNNQTVTFTDCTFDADVGCDAPRGVQGDTQYGAGEGQNNSIVLVRPTFTSRIVYGAMIVGGNLTITGGTWAGTTGIYIGNSRDYSHLTINGTGATWGATNWLSYNGGSGNHDTFTFSNLAINQANNTFDGSLAFAPTPTGIRAITGGAGTNPKNVPAAGLVGDTYFNGTNTWTCTSAGISNAVWSP